VTETDDPIATRLRQGGREYFGADWMPEVVARAPGRIEIIGNHIDYNGGPVLAAAIDREIHIGSAPSARNSIRVAFADHGNPGPFEVLTTELIDWRLAGGAPAPIDYVRGVIASLNARDLPVEIGRDLVVAGNLPAGLGISSSAALCVALTITLVSTRPEDGEIVLIAQEAEHRIGSPCGTMDQSASVAGGLIAYSGEDNSVATKSADLGDLVFVVINSGLERNLATSAYPTRVRESKAILKILREELYPQLDHLAELESSELRAIEARLERADQPALASRARHVITETGRVQWAIAAVAQQDWSLVGDLMTASGESSSRDYEISHPAVDELVRLSLGVEGVLGARMMGGGEGGAALTLIHRDAVRELETALVRDYYDPRGLSELEPKVVPCTFAQGAGIVGVSR
jgi:galactokinase